MTFTTPPTAVVGAIVDESYTDIVSDNDNHFNTLLGTPSGVGQVPISISTSQVSWGTLATANIANLALATVAIADQNVTAAKINAAALTLAKLSSALQAYLVPSADVGWVRTAAEIASGWSRETRLDGRMPGGAGTAFVTFSEDTAYGSSWSHSHAFSASVGSPSATVTDLKLSNETSASESNHTTHSLSGTTSSDAWVIPSRAVVFCRKS